MENLSEEEGLRVATIRAENANEATTVTAEAATAAASAAATVATIMIKEGIEGTTGTDTIAASGLRRNKKCASAAVGKCEVNDGTIDGTVMIRYTHCIELMQVESRDDYTCYKPECIGKRLELEATNHMVTEEMNWAYSDAFKTA